MSNKKQLEEGFKKIQELAKSLNLVIDFRYSNGPAIYSKQFPDEIYYLRRWVDDGELESFLTKAKDQLPMEGDVFLSEEKY